MLMKKKDKDLMSETLYKYDKHNHGVQLVINNYERCTVFLSSSV